ncbi:MAG: putative lipid II flippase FtsW [Bacteroidetes bacterium]|nr:putative lipid II flippase FtsW [Bacteroidota bacterium]MBU1116555.1 putative lipid II flippase FtsW [Bacteroidota bacterium]MBU1797555.1 putative lipid II flippase FtsW [Bacteroidota bacterium]
MKILVRILLAIVLSLMVLGAILVFTASSTYSEVRFDNIYFLFKSHISKMIFAILVGIVFSIIPYQYYNKYSKQALLFVIVLLIFTVLLAPKYKGAARWIDLGIIQFQPSELVKLVLFMHIAGLIERKGKLIEDFKNGFKYPLILIIAVAGLVVIQPNLSTAMIIVFTSFILLYIGGAKLKHIVASLGVLSLAGISLMMLFSHSRSRILGFISSFNGNNEPNIQVLQAKIGLGSGGLFGVGVGASRQSDLFLPESYGDFIFSILGEQFGFLGATVVLLLFFTLFNIGIIIAKKSDNQYGQLLAFAISFNIIISAFLNASVVTGLMPTTGITLPFISFGGTSIILFCASVGILINIANQGNKDKTVRVSTID